MANHLQNQTSPYLRQHGDNPVDWYPWCQEAFQRAREEDKPIFLSVGYSTCHWCHVMARESFQDPEVAELLNEGFVSIKVDREERPDIDSLSMSICQAFTGGGGWPTTVFLTPDQIPFFAGTYFPKDSSRGLPGLLQLLPAIRRAWQTDRDRLMAQGEQVLAYLQAEAPPAAEPDTSLLKKALDQWRASFDPVWGGFGSAPKFPMGHSLVFLLACGEKTGDKPALAMAEKTLEQLYLGGIFDHVGGGFARYSTDRQFLVPHFEKMLYDNALLTLAYCKAYQVTRRSLYLQVAQRTADYVLRDLILPGGAFAGAQDADSGGEEGRYYTLTPEEVLSVLGAELGEKFNRCYHITPEGNFLGKNIPNLLQGLSAPEDCEEALPLLRAYREKRCSLARDDKVLTGWNGLMIAALAALYRVSGQERYLEGARGALAYLDRVHWRGDDLFATSLAEQTGPKAFLEDYAFLSFGLLHLYEATLEPRYLDQAQSLCRRVLADFPDKGRGGFYLAAKDSQPLLLRPKETADGALPSGNTMLGYVLVRLAQLTEEETWDRAAQEQLAFLAGQAAAYPTAYPVYLLALLARTHPPEEITLVLAPGQTPPAQPWPFPLDAVVKILPGPQGDYALLDGKTTYYVCKDHTCLPPTTQYPR